MTSSCPEGANLQDPSNCTLIDDKEDDILKPFERMTDTPILIDRSLFSTNLQTDLKQCDGTTSCKYVGFDFDRDTGTRINNMAYNIDISYIGGSKGVFTKEGQTVPTMMIAPPGYIYSPAALTGDITFTNLSCPNGGTYNPFRKLCIEEAFALSSMGCQTVNLSTYGCRSGFTPDGWSSGAVLACTTRYCKKDPAPFPATVNGIQECKQLCDTEQTCIGFNFKPFVNDQNCEMLKNITGDNITSDSVGFKRHDFPTSEGKLNPNAPDALTYLGNTGNDCSEIDACNSNIAHVFDTPGVTALATTDIETCGYCPVKTINKVASEYYVRDEVGRTTKYTQPSAALAALQYSKVPNPRTTETTLLGLYKVTPYTGTKSRYIFITNSSHLIMIHAEHHDPNTIDRRTGEPADPFTGRFNFLFPVNAVQFSFVQYDGKVNGTLSVLSQFGPENKINSIVGNGTTTTVTTAIPHGLVTTSTIFLYGDDLPSSFLNPTIISGNITVIPNPESTVDAPKPSVSFTFRNPPQYPYSGSSSAVKLFYSKQESRGISTWGIKPVDYVTNGFQFTNPGMCLKKATDTSYRQTEMPQFFEQSVVPEKYSKDFADTVFVVEKVQIGSQYSVYECPAFDQRNSDCYDYGEKHRGHTWFLQSGKCESAPTLNRWSGTPTCAGMCSTGCPDGFRRLIADDVGCLDHLTNGFNMS